jgi:hypothetical protein
MGGGGGGMGGKGPSGAGLEDRYNQMLAQSRASQEPTDSEYPQLSRAGFMGSSSPTSDGPQMPRNMNRLGGTRSLGR